MKAEFKKTKAADGLPLTFGKMYDVLGVTAGKRPWELKGIKVKNDLGQERWYKASRFKLFAEDAAYLREPTAAGAGQGAAQSATPDGSQMYIGIDLAGETDMTVTSEGFTAREMIKYGEAVLAGYQAGIGLHYGA